tara:strand:- start:194 stop:859 length:666 start_codon:yes stop_codon:yes gene_type:complete
MSKINLHPDDRVLSISEMMRQMVIPTVVILVFLFAFFIPMSQGIMTEECDYNGDNCQMVEDPFTVIAGYCLGGCFSFILVALWIQVFMVIIGKGKMVMTADNSMTLRTSRSGTTKPSRFDFIGRIIHAPFAKMMMKDLDKDGDRKISFDEFIDDDDMFSDVGSKTEFQELKEEFDRYDTDGDGYITYKELQDSIISGGETWAEDKPKVEGKPDNWWSDEDN